MKITILEETISRDGNLTVVFLVAEVNRNDSRELPLVEGTFIVTGKSICCPEDTFDELIGKRIARSRAYKALYQKVRETYKNKLRDFNISLKISQDCMEKYERAIEAQDKDIERLINGK